MFTASSQQPNNVSGTTFSRTPSLLAEEKKSIAPYIFTACMFIIAVLALALCAYAYHQKDIYQKQVEAKKEELNRVTFNQEGATLQDIEDLSGRLRGIISIFTSAPSASSVFTIFESATERGVAFNRLEVNRVEGSKSYKVTVSGNANTFKDLILQRDTFRLAPYSKYVSDVTVTNFNRDLQTGNISFTITAVISVGRFGVANLLVDLTKPSENLTPVVGGGVTLPRVSVPLVLPPAQNKVSTSLPALGGGPLITSTTTKQIATSTGQSNNTNNP